MEPAEIRLAQGFPASYAVGWDSTTSKAGKNVPSVKARENQAMDFPVHAAEAKDLTEIENRK
jgi:hypothetical protein